MPINEDEKQDARFEKGVSCPHCFDTQDERQRQRFAERQKQIDLAKARNESHIAADIDAAKSAKKVQKEIQREKSRGN